MKTNRILSMVAASAMLAAMVGCDSSTAVDDTVSANADVAESLAKLTAEDTGGLVEQVGDVMELATVGDIHGQSDAIAAKFDSFTVERSYDEATGTWTISVSRELGDPEGERYLSFSRTYQVQFLNEGGAPQKFFVTASDTAHAISFVIVEGSGTLTTPHISAQRENITGEWMATGVNTDTVTLNGTYGRSGGHTITSLEAVRTLDYELSLEVVDLVGPKGSRRDLSQKLSGTITGQYDATATFERGDAYREREISKQFTIVIEDGTATITVEGQVFGSNVRSGDLTSG